MIATEVEETYPLTPMQGGMLFHALYGLDSDVYFGQAHWDMRGPLDFQAFAQAWQEVVRRHSILRTSFEWMGVTVPTQRVHRDAVVPMEYVDWRGLPPTARAERIENFLREDRARGFDLTRPPLLRITTIRLSEAEHRVVWSGHHLLVDGRSINLIVREVMALYTGFVTDMPVALPRPAPYSAFVSWLQDRDMAETEWFWRNTLRGFTVPTSFQLEARERDAPATAAEEIEVPDGGRAALAALARASGVTFNTVIMASWALLCSRYSRSRDVVFGVSVGSGGKGAPVSRSLAGLLVNTLPLRVPVHPDESTIELLQRVRAGVRDLKRFAHSSLVDVTRWSDIPLGMPLFDHIVVFDNAAIDRLSTRYGDLEIGRIAIEQQSSYPLNLVAPPGRGGSFRLLYAPQSISPDRAHQLGRHLREVMTRMTDNPKASIGQFSILTREERRRMLGEWNRGRMSGGPTIATLAEAFERQVERTPGADAVSCAGEVVTYAELHRRAGAVARQLRDRGVGPEVVVALALERSIALIVGMVAIAQAGGACLLLDPEAPPARLAFMVRDARATVCVTSRGHRYRLPAELECIYPADVCPSGRDGEQSVAVASSALAYVVYTSGTTGEPKGVAIEHRNAANLIAWHISSFRVTEADRVSQVASPGFDAVVWEIWPNLAAGGCICIPADEVRRSPARLQHWLIAEGISVAFAPTPLAEGLLALDWPKHAALRTLLVGGDVLRRRPDASLPFTTVNNYGPSECTVVATSGTIVPDERGLTRRPAIGRPIAGTEVYLLDENLQPVPAGVPGELYIGGAGVGRGYLHRPDATARAFIPHPFVDAPHARLYRTGDLARYAPDGTIEFVGRIDDQIQLRGFRIEPGEVETLLRRHQGVRDALVTARRDTRGTTSLAAYIVPENGARPPSSALRENLRASLPEYMIPATFSMVDTLPLTANGKIDRDALPPPTLEVPVVEPAVEISPTSVEGLLAAIWKATLRVDRVGLHDSFFDLGGNSLLAIELLERIRVGLGHELLLSDLFRAPTVAGLAATCGTGTMPFTRGAVVPIQPLGSRPPFFCAAPVLGTVFPYYELAYAMRPDQPFYGLQPLGVPATSSTIESIAERYVGAIREVQRTGPYHLGGWSFGGLVAFEMAQQLRRAGEEVALLAVLDTPAPGLQRYLHAPQSLRLFAATIASGAWEYIRDYEYLALDAAQRSTPTHASGALSWGIKRAYSLGRSFATRAAIAGVVPAESRLLLYHLPTLREMLGFLFGGLVSTLRYRPAVYPGPVSLLRTAEHSSAGPYREFLGWETVSDEAVRAYAVPGNHLTLLRKPHLPVLAETLQGLLDATQRGPEEGPARRSSPTRSTGQSMSSFH